MRFIHSADWQIGARFRQFGEKAGWLREVRLRTLERALRLAEERDADAFLVAGDFFEDHQIDATTLAKVMEILVRHQKVPVFILPGNHDPASGPGSIWCRHPFVSPPPHVTVFNNARKVALGDGWLIANPLSQKRSTIDPSRKLAELAGELPTDVIKVGITHGSLALGNQFEPDDFPISVDAATRSGLDYLAVGHWHSEHILDGGRLVMPGTPEQTGFGEHTAGRVQEVEIASAGAVPKLTPHMVGELTWTESTCEVSDGEHARAQLERITTGTDPARTVLRVTFTGNASPACVAELEATLRARLSVCPILEVRDETTPEFSPAELEALHGEHPLLSQVLEDLQTLGSSDGPRRCFEPAQVAQLLQKIGCAPEELNPQLISTARRLLLGAFREVRT